MRGAPLRRRPTERTLAAGTSQREWRIERAARLDPPSLGVSMLHVMHDVGDGRLLVRFEGSLDERAADSVLSAVALTPVAVRVMLDLGRTTSILDCALARLSQVLKARDGRFRGLRPRHERFLKSVHLQPLSAARSRCREHGWSRRGGAE